MDLRRIVVATDASEAGRAAIRAGRQMAEAAGGELIVMTAALNARAAVAVGGGTWDQGIDSVDALARHLSTEFDNVVPPNVELALVAGLPGIEVPRFAEERGAGLIVLGRKPRSQAARLVMGDTADAVARRSRIPCLIVPNGSGRFTRVLAALDGTPRADIVFDAACGFARPLGAELGVVTVERRGAGEPAALSARLPGARSERVTRSAQELGARCGLAVRAMARQGETVPEILAEAASWDVLAVGYHRGGPPGIIEAGSVARRLAHGTPGALLTVPL
ncbi:MAG TPA: universal stress protein [Gemmatimonadales bacterium]